MDPAFHTIAWLDRQIAMGSATFFCADDAAIVTEFREYPTGAKDIHGLIAAGNLATITGVLIPEAEAFARSQGAIGAIIESREGWSKALRDSGYAPYQTAVRKAF